ncbi:universal stress protein [Hymenobacter rubripertinctus]|uniref:universal stress protein n=1 Tax=Hymenobacter rubripertinctus TaxID=2029981 RepID=UPI0016046F7D|nr:universal stress protein [Hymenobacter rubripertinctus]
MTDFSGAAANALHYAVVLAQYVGARIQLWHIAADAGIGAVATAYFSLPAQPLTPAQALQLLTQQSRQVNRLVPCQAALISAAALHDLAAPAGGGPAHHVLVVGNSRPIKSVSSAETSTALHLIRTMRHPLLVVPLTYRVGGIPRRIVLDTDHRAVRVPVTAETIAALLARLTASPRPLTLTHLPADVDHLLQQVIPAILGLHVYTGEKAPELRETAHQIRQTGLVSDLAHTVATVRHSSVEEGIRHAAMRHGAELLVFIARQRTCAGPRFLRSVTAGLLAHSRIPVLAVPEA